MTKRVVARLFLAVALPALPFFSGWAITPGHAATITVNTPADEETTNGSCSLREAIENANADAATNPDCAAGSAIDTIGFSGNYTITLSGAALPALTTTIAINGKGAANTIIQANASPNVATYRVLSNSGNSSLNGLTIRNGRCSGSCNGGGIANSGTLAVTNSTLAGNTAGSYGGAIENDGTLTVTNSTFTGNAAPNGGAIHSDAGYTLTLTGSVLSGNSATNGGALSGYSATVTVIDSTLSGNNAVNYGGAIYNSGNGNLSVRTSTLTGNTGGLGGAISNAHNLIVANSTLSGNQAYDYGGAIYSSGSAWFYNSTVVFNTLIEGTNLGAGGIDGDVALYNTIVAGNIRAISSTYRDCSGNLYTEGRNLFWDTTNCTINVGSGSWGYLNGFGYLGPLQNNGGPTQTHALLLGSNAIDTGSDTLCSAYVSNLDQRGVTRPQGSNCDIGAFEYQDAIFRSGFDA